ncbi:MAG: putative membrane protein [Parasphingorhabdus sp.]|jgi:uncharacterized membrane protein
MKLFQSIPLTIVAGVVLAILLVLALGPTGYNALEMVVWLHVIMGVTWIGLLYYFNLVQVPAVNEAVADGDPGPAAINKYVAPRALHLFRWSAVLTWLTGAAALETLHGGDGSGIVAAFTFSDNMASIGVGAWLGTIMLFNVWVLIWPNQKKLLGMVQASDEEKAAAKKTALIASRANTMLSIPMLMSMTMYAHGLPF